MPTSFSSRRRSCAILLLRATEDAALRERADSLRRIAAEPGPDLLLRPRDDDPAVGGPEVLERDDRRVRRVGASRRDVAARGGPRADVHQLVLRRFEQRDITVAADAVTPRAPEACEDGD